MYDAAWAMQRLNLIRQMKFDAAIKHFEKTKDQLARKLGLNSPRFVDAVSVYTRALAGAGRTSEAVQVQAALVQRISALPEFSRFWLVGAQLRLARNLIEAGDANQALPLLDAVGATYDQQGRRTSTRYINLRMSKAEALLMMGRVEAAQEQLREVPEAGQALTRLDRAYYFRLMAQLSAAQGDMRQALQQLEQGEALLLRDGLPPSLPSLMAPVHRALLLGTAGRHAEARALRDQIAQRLAAAGYREPLHIGIWTQLNRIVDGSPGP